MLTPDNAWGNRLLAEFEQHWSSLGGELLEAQRYTPETRENASNQVKALLNIDLGETAPEPPHPPLGATQ